mgnify:FL=1
MIIPLTDFPAPPAIDRFGGIPPQTPRPTGLTTHLSPAIEALRADPASADSFWAGVEAQGTPLVEAILDSADAAITFLWRGEARQVAVVLNKLTDPSTLREAMLEQIPGTEIWARTLRLGEAWRGSYSIAVEPLGGAQTSASPQADTRRERSLAVSDPAQHAAINAWFAAFAWASPDPLARARSGLASVASAPRAPRFTLPDGAPPGRLIPATLANGSRGWWHIPAGPAPEQWDVRVLFDGDDQQGERLDAWVAAGVKRRVTLLVDSGDLRARVRDLSCSTAMIQALVNALDGADPSDFGAPLTRDPAGTSIAGQSLGGLSALFAQCVAPQRFGASVCQSGSFWWPNVAGSGPANASSAVVPEWLTHAIETSRPQLSRVHLEVGTHEWVLLEPTRRLRDVLADVTESLHYREFDGGHDSACWEVQLPSALMALED